MTSFFSGKATSSTSLLFSILIALGNSAFANSASCSDFANMPAEICKLSTLIGEWSGSGWYMEPSGKKSVFDSNEEIHPDLDGRILVMHGLQKADNQVVNNAFTIFSYNTKAAKYKFSTYLANGYGGDYDMDATDNGFVWNMSMGPAQVRYTVKIEDGHWLETGERSVDGVSWIQFFEQNLIRK